MPSGRGGRVDRLKGGRGPRGGILCGVRPRDSGYARYWDCLLDPLVLRLVPENPMGHFRKT